jgi:predicted dehydrogenase
MSSNKLRWGVLGVAGIAVKKVIPAMQKCSLCEISAIASRDLEKARQAAPGLGIAKAYGSYEEMLADPEIDVIYNPLPNHLHVPWSIKAMEAGKHVLCEKPLGLSSAEVRDMIAVREQTGRIAGEAFMICNHPQWLRAREVIQSGAIGDLRGVVSWFSYTNRDPKNVRNVAGWGGGGLMDIGCYGIFSARFLFGEEPRRVSGTLEFDPDFKTDRLASAVLDFPSGQATFLCSTQMVPGQRVLAFGTKGRIEIEIPFNAPPDAQCRIWVDGREELFDICDQYTLQGDAFSRAVLGQGPVPVPLENSLGNMAVIDAIVESSHSGRWVSLG